MDDIKYFLDKNISKKDQKLLIILFGAILLACSYFWGYRGFMEKKSTQDAYNNEKLAEISIRNEYAISQSTYEQETARINEETAAIKKQFPPQIHSENSIINAMNLEKDSLSLRISNIGIAESTLIQSTLEEDMEPSEYKTAATEMGLTAQYAYELYNTPVTYQFTSGYGDFKNTLSAIRKNLDTKSIESVVMTYDSTTSSLIGTLIVNQYMITGTDQEYITPEVKASTIGNPNPFATTE